MRNTDAKLGGDVSVSTGEQIQSNHLGDMLVRAYADYVDAFRAAEATDLNKLVARHVVAEEISLDSLDSLSAERLEALGSQVLTAHFARSDKVSERADANGTLLNMILDMEGFTVTATSTAPKGSRSPIELQRYDDTHGWTPSRERNLRTASGVLSTESATSIWPGVLYLNREKKLFRTPSRFAIRMSGGVALNVYPTAQQ